MFLDKDYQDKVLAKNPTMQCEQNGLDTT